MRAQLLDGVGASVLFAVSVLPFGCINDRLSDDQAFVAASGAYGTMDIKAKPQPGVCQTCLGKKVVGDGRVMVPCPACQPKAAVACDCGCGGRGYLIRSDGGRVACPCPPDCSCKCKDGTCRKTQPTAR